MNDNNKEVYPGCNEFENKIEEKLNKKYIIIQDIEQIKRATEHPDFFKQWAYNVRHISKDKIFKYFDVIIAFVSKFIKDVKVNIYDI